VRRQALDLLDIEDRVAIHERDRVFDVFAGLRILLGPGDGIGVNDQLAVLALADIGAKLFSLPEGHPDRCAIAFGNGGGPEHQDVDAVIGQVSALPQSRRSMASILLICDMLY